VPGENTGVPGSTRRALSIGILGFNKTIICNEIPTSLINLQNNGKVIIYYSISRFTNRFIMSIRTSRSYSNRTREAASHNIRFKRGTPFTSVLV